MAYDGNKLSQRFGDFDGGWNFWTYAHTDTIATVNTAGYISDAAKRGMKVGDTVLVRDTATPSQSLCYVASITNGAADVTDGLTVTATNTD